MKIGTVRWSVWVMQAIVLIALVVAVVLARRAPHAAAERVAARAAALDSFCGVKRRDLEATAQRFATAAHLDPVARDAAVLEFSDVFLSDDGQEKMILCMGLSAWQRVSPEGRALACSAAHDDACMVVMVTAAATALGGSAAK